MSGLELVGIECKDDAGEVTYRAVRVVIPGPPCAQGRPRAFNTPKGIRMYDPKKSRSWKGAAQVHMAEAMAGRALFAGAVQVEIVAVFACPTTDYRKRDPHPRRWHTKANGDAENISKACCDAANGTLWIDDRQVARLHVEKIIGAQGEAPRVEMYVSALEGREQPVQARTA